jgi:hypothetical protein
VCERCTAEVMPEELFPAARMLVDAGVDRLSLADRMRALTKNQLSAFATRFDAQWSIMQKRIEETRFVESFLLQKGFKEDLEDQLIAQIPVSDEYLKTLSEGPKPPFETLEHLETIAKTSPLEDTRTLASIALIHRRRLTREGFENARHAMHSHRWLKRLASEAAIALSRWFVRATPDIPWLGRWDVDSMKEAARPLLNHEALAPYAVLAMQLDEPAILRRGLNSPDADLAFSCALLLREEAELAKALDGTDELKAAAARSVLGRTQSKLLHRRLREDSDDKKVEIIKSLRHPVEAALIDALLEGAANGSDEVRHQALQFLFRGQFSDLPRESRESIASFLSRPDVAADDVMRALDFASDDILLFAEAATSLFGRTAGQEIGPLLEKHRWVLRKWIKHAEGEREQKLLDAWIGDRQAAEMSMAAAIDSEAKTIFLAWWDRQNATQAAPVFAKALAKNRGSFVREQLVPELWKRFKEREADRAAILSLLTEFRYDVKELRALEPKNSPFGMRDLVRFYQTFALADPLEAPNYLSNALEEARQERGQLKRDFPQLAPLADVVYAHAIVLGATHPCTAARAAANLASHTVNAYRAEPQNDDLQNAVARLKSYYPQLIDAFDSARPVDSQEGRFSHVIEQIDTELRIAAEAEERHQELLERERERETRERDRELREMARVEEALEREREMAARQAEARALALARAAAAAVGVQLDVGPKQIMPNIPLEGIDREPLFMDQPLPTLLDYVGFLKAMSLGGDIMKLMSERGMDPMQWGACATAWSTAMQTRPNLAMRFAALFQATWS